MRVALNPYDTDTVSFFDPGTGVNLFRNTPVSAETEVSEGIKQGLLYGLLVVVEGETPSGVSPPKFLKRTPTWTDEEAVKQYIVAVDKYLFPVPKETKQKGMK
jgi:hypothetical protein